MLRSFLSLLQSNSCIFSPPHRFGSSSHLLERSWGTLCPRLCKYRGEKKKLSDCKLKLGIFKYPNVRMQRGNFRPTPGQTHEEVPLAGNSKPISLSYRCLHLVCAVHTHAIAVQYFPPNRLLSCNLILFYFCNCRL